MARGSNRQLRQFVAERRTNLSGQCQISFGPVWKKLIPPYYQQPIKSLQKPAFSEIN